MPSKRRRQAASLQRGFQLTATSPPPGFFVSVASKGFIQAVSLLFATLAARSISVASKGLMGAKCRRESNGLGCDDVIALHGKPHNRVGASRSQLRTGNRGWGPENESEILRGCCASIE